MPRVHLDGCRLVAPPPDGFFRVSRWHDPFDPPDPPPAIADPHVESDNAGRWDSPDGSFRVLYCATEAEGAIGEKLAAFALRIDLAVRIENFFEEPPDEEFAEEQLVPQLDAEDIEGLGWQLARAPPRGELPLLDISHPRTLVAITPGVLDLVVAYGLRWFDRHALLDERRNLTRRLAGRIRAAAERPDGSLTISGLRYESRLPPAWECWALWEPPPLDASEQVIEPLTIDHPAMRSAAHKLGVLLRY